MKVYYEINLCDFEFWACAKDTVKYLTIGDLIQFENAFKEWYPDGMSATQINDFFWFEDDYIAQFLGYPDFKTLVKEREKEEQ